MNYAEVRDRIGSGDLLAFTGARLYQRAIQARTWSRYCHVGQALRVRFGSGPERLFVVESHVYGGVQMAALSTAGPFDWVPLPPRCDWRPEAEHFVAERVGRTPYDWRSIIRTAVGLPMRDDMRMTCNEFVVRLSQRCGVTYREQHWTQDPGGVVDAWLSQGGHLERVEA